MSNAARLYYVGKDGYVHSTLFEQPSGLSSYVRIGDDSEEGNYYHLDRDVFRTREQAIRYHTQHWQREIERLNANIRQLHEDSDEGMYGY